jgi:hypothetical protein
MKKYFIVYNPATYELMNIDMDKCTSPLDLITYLTNRDANHLNAENYLDFLHFDLQKRRVGMVETFGIENGAAIYIGNQIARLAPDTQVIQADDNRAALREAIERQGTKPAAVFMTAISSNFPGAVAAAIVLNHAQIPVVLGGIHVSTSTQDVDVFIRAFCPYPELVMQVRGPGDSEVIGGVMRDLEQGTLQSQYAGHITIEDGVWRTPENVLPLPSMFMRTRGKISFIGQFLEHKVRLIPVAPLLGCPYSCSFCSVSTLPLSQRRLAMRTPDDFLDELESLQDTNADVTFPIFLFCTDNLLLGGNVLDEMLAGMVERNLKTPFMAQISIEVASNEDLLKRMRQAGAMLFEIGFESLDMQNLEHINKHCIYDIRKSKLSVPEYYAWQIQKILDHGIAIQGSFMFGLPFDRFDSLEDNTGTEVAQFCLDTHISLMAGCFCASPGARDFEASLQAGTFLYGKPGTMEYLRSLCIADHCEMNTQPPEGLRKSPLLVAIMALEALRRVGIKRHSIRNAAFMGHKAFAYPTACGRVSYKGHAMDYIAAFANHLITTSLYREHGVRLATSRNGLRGVLERLFEAEKDPAVRRLCRDYVAGFMQQKKTTAYTGNDSFSNKKCDTRRISAHA